MVVWSRRIRHRATCGPEGELVRDRHRLSSSLTTLLDHILKRWGRDQMAAYPKLPLNMPAAQR